MTIIILDLGGGWGGLTAGQALRGMLSSEYRVTTMDKNNPLFIILHFLSVVIKEKAGSDYVERPLKSFT